MNEYKLDTTNDEKINTLTEETVMKIKDLGVVDNVKNNETLKTIFKNFGSNLIKNTDNAYSFGKGLDSLLEKMNKNLPQYVNKNNEVNNDMKEVLAESIVSLNVSSLYREELIGAVTDFKRSAINKEPLLQIVNDTVVKIKELGLIDNLKDNEALKTIFKNFGKKIMKNTEDTTSFGKHIYVLIQEIQVNLPQYTSTTGKLKNTMREVLAESIISLNLSTLYRDEVIAAATDFHTLTKVGNKIGDLRENFVSNGNKEENKNKLTN